MELHGIFTHETPHIQGAAFSKTHLQSQAEECQQKDPAAPNVGPLRVLFLKVSPLLGGYLQSRHTITRLHSS